MTFLKVANSGHFCHVHGMPHDPMSLIEEAMGAALTQFINTTGVDFPTIPQLLLVEDQDFWAEAEVKQDELVISVTEGLIETVFNFWTNVLEEQPSTDGSDPIPATADDLIHTSLVWLLLHELHHFQLGHFGLTGRFSLSEAKEANSFGALKRRSTKLPKALELVPFDDLPKVEPCLEMQADHDAIEMALDAYSTDGWHIIRARTAAISGMMVLIEREDAKRGHNLSSHPKAATRVFQLIGHVMQMPRIEEIISRQHPELGIDPYVPSKDEGTAYNRQVSRPAFFDVLELARAAKAASIVTDLETPDRFFRDVAIARTQERSSYSDMSTVGSKQWAGLEKLNSTIVQS